MKFNKVKEHLKDLKEENQNLKSENLELKEIIKNFEKEKIKKVENLN